MLAFILTSALSAAPLYPPPVQFNNTDHHSHRNWEQKYMKDGASSRTVTLNPLLDRDKGSKQDDYRNPYSNGDEKR